MPNAVLTGPCSFPYTYTLKCLEKWGPGCHFLGKGLDEDIDELERILERESETSTPPALALFTEFPSNPLLRSANLPRLRTLADKYDFLIVVDETIGNFVNVEVLPYADIVVSSLSKIFSGDANVMGGRYVLSSQILCMLPPLCLLVCPFLLLSRRAHANGPPTVSCSIPRADTTRR